MNAKRLELTLGALRRKLRLSCPDKGTAYEIISDHTLHSKPTWSGLQYSKHGRPAMILKEDLEYKRQEIERLRTENAPGITHWLLASERAVKGPVLYKIRVAGDGQPPEAAQFSQAKGKWDSIANPYIGNNLIKLHTKVLWKGLFSHGEIYDANTPCVSLVFGYKASSLVIGIWALHAMTRPWVKFIESEATISDLLYPPIFCLNASLAARYRQADHRRWDLALLAMRAITGYRYGEQELREAIREGNLNIPPLVMNVLDGTNLDPRAGRAGNYRDLLLQVVEMKCHARLTRDSLTKCQVLEALCECFVGWHLDNPTSEGLLRGKGDGRIFVRPVLERLLSGGPNADTILSDADRLLGLGDGVSFLQLIGKILGSWKGPGPSSIGESRAEVKAIWEVLNNTLGNSNAV